MWVRPAENMCHFSADITWCNNTTIRVFTFIDGKCLISYNLIFICTYLTTSVLFFDHINLHLYLTYIILYSCIHEYHIYLICTIIIHIKNWFGHFAWSQVKNRQPQFLRSHWTIFFFLRSWIFMMIMGCQIKTSDFYKSSQSNWYWLNFRCNELLVMIQRILFPLQKAAWHSTMQDVLFWTPRCRDLENESRVMMNVLSTLWLEIQGFQMIPNGSSFRETRENRTSPALQRPQCCKMAGDWGVFHPTAMHTMLLG